MDRDEGIEGESARRLADNGVEAEPLGAAVSGDDAGRRRTGVEPRERRVSAVAGLSALVVLACALSLAGLWLRGGWSGGVQPVANVSTPPGGSGLIGCWGGQPGFSPNLLDTAQPSAETADTPPAAALRALLASPYSGMPTAGWILVSESSSQTVFIHVGTMADGNVEVTVVPGAPGPGGIGADGWSAGGYGSCMLYSVPPTGYGVATWTLDPAVPYVAGGTELHILVTDMACHSFETADGRIAPNVEYRNDTVIVTLAVRSLEGAQACPGTAPTPYVLHLDQPVGGRNLVDGGPWPVQTIAAGGQVVIPPTPTPEPSNWHMPMDCTGEADGAGSFKAASMSATFDVYCAALPAGWQRQAMTGDSMGSKVVTATYRGPNGEIFELSEGDLCGGLQSACAPGGSDLGKAMFGDREGQLVAGPSGADYALYVDAGQSPSWMATGTGMSQDTFKALTAAVIVVGK